MIETEEIILKKYTCLRCKEGHEWYPRKPVKPRICPACKSASWNVPRKNNKNRQITDIYKTS